MPFRTASFVFVNNDNNSSKPDININMSLRCKHLPHRESVTQWLPQVSLPPDVLADQSVCSPRKCFLLVMINSYCKTFRIHKQTSDLQIYIMPVSHHIPFTCFVNIRRAPASGLRRNLFKSSLYSLCTVCYLLPVFSFPLRTTTSANTFTHTLYNKSRPQSYTCTQSTHLPSCYNNESHART